MTIGVRINWHSVSTELSMLISWVLATYALSQAFAVRPEGLSRVSRGGEESYALAFHQVPVTTIRPTGRCLVGFPAVSLCYLSGESRFAPMPCSFVSSFSWFPYLHGAV